MIEFIRPSSLDRAASCPASIAESVGKPNIGSDESAEGSAVHEAFALLVAARDPATIDYAAIGRKHAVDASYIRDVVIDSGFIPTANAEPEHPVTLELGDGLPPVRGTADLVIPSECAVLDYKVSQLRGDAPEVGERLQVLAYGAAVALDRGWFGVKAQVFNPLMGFPRGLQSLDVDPGKILDEVRFVVRRAVEQFGKASREYRPGPACTFCPARATCPGANAAVKAMLPVLAQDGPMVPLERVPSALIAIRDIKKRIESFEEWANGTLDMLPGKEIVADGLVARRSTKQVKASFSLKKALEFMRSSGFGEAADAVEAHGASLGKVETWFRYVGPVKADKKAKEVEA